MIHLLAGSGGAPGPIRAIEGVFSEKRAPALSRAPHAKSRGQGPGGALARS